MTLLTNVLQLWRPGQYIKPHDAGPRLSHLFQGVQGAAFNVNVLSSLWLDTARTTPAVIEQPVACMDDLSGNGNHAIQATSPKRPVLSARANLLTNSEFTGYTAGTPGTAPTGWGFSFNFGETLTSVKGVRLKAANQRHFLQQVFATPAISQTYEYSVDVDVHLGEKLAWLVFALGPIANIDYLLDGAPVTSTSFVGTGTHTILLRITTNGTAGNIDLRVGSGTAGAVAGTVDITLIRGSFLLSTDAHLPYQRVNSDTNYDIVGFPYYDKLDGVDDSLASATGGGGNTAFYFSAGILPNSQGTARTLFSDAGSNTGYTVRINASNQLEIAAGNGTAYTTVASVATIPANSLAIVQAWDDGVNLNVQVDNGSVASIARPSVSAGTAGFTLAQNNGAATGNFGGRLYGAIYLKDVVTTPQERAFAVSYLSQAMRRPI